MSFEYVPWEEFPAVMDWEQGEHVTIIAPTGGGKTTLIRELIPLRKYIVFLVSKKRDSTLDGQLEGFTSAQIPQPYMEKVVVKPPFPKDPRRLFEVQRRYFERAILTAFKQENWTIVADEVRVLSEKLKLDNLLELVLIQGRSLGVSLVAATQRPRHIPLEFYDQPEHLFFFKDTDRNNLARIADIGGAVNRTQIMRAVKRLDRYHFIYVNTRTDEVVESKVEL